MIVGQAAAKTVVRERSGARIVNEDDDVGASADCAARGVRSAVRWHGSCCNRFVHLAKDKHAGVRLKRCSTAHGRGICPRQRNRAVACRGLEAGNLLKKSESESRGAGGGFP